jgi:hypothetical protein
MVYGLCMGLFAVTGSGSGAFMQIPSSMIKVLALPPHAGRSIKFLHGGGQRSDGTGRWRLEPSMKDPFGPWPREKVFGRLNPSPPHDLTGLCVAMRAFASIDDVLRATSSARIYSSTGRALRIVTMAVVAGACYGAVMGAFELRPMQMLISATKVPMLLGVTFMISLPSFFVFNTIFGLRGEFGVTFTALLTSQATLLIALASLCPLTALCYCSTNDYNLAVLFNGGMFALATIAGQITLRKAYRMLIALHPRHRTMLRLWMLTYCFVGIQMAWVLRPFVGSPREEPHFFREGDWSNAYVFVGRLIWNAVRR